MLWRRCNATKSERPNGNVKAVAAISEASSSYWSISILLILQWQQYSFRLSLAGKRKSAIESARQAGVNAGTTRSENGRSTQSPIWGAWFTQFLSSRFVSLFSLSLTVCFFFSFFLFFLLYCPVVQTGGIQALLASQLASIRGLLLGKRFVRRLQRANGPNTRSKDVVGVLVKTPGFPCI